MGGVIAELAALPLARASRVHRGERPEAR
jgi:hypothetical protein